MDIRKYEVLLKVIDKGSFAAAANELGYTPSGVSQMMNALEEECGVNLLQRSNRGVQLTKQGQAIYPYILKTINMKEKLEEKFEEVKGYNAGKLRIVGFSSTTCSLILPIVQTFRRIHPKVEVEILEENSPKIMADWIQSEVADIAITTRSPYFDCEWINLERHPYVAVFSKNHPLAIQDKITAEQLRNEEVLMYKSAHGYDFAAGKYLNQENIKTVSNFTSNSNYIMLHMIEETNSICIVTKMLWDFNSPMHPGLVARPLVPALMTDIILAVKSFNDCSNAANAFIKCTKMYIKDKKEKN